MVAAVRDPERLRGELEAAGLLRAEDAFELVRAEDAFELVRAEDAFELVRAEPAFALLRATEFELLRAAEFELLRAELGLRRLELAAVAPLSLAAGRLRSPGFDAALCLLLVRFATSRPLYGRWQRRRRPCNIDCGARSLSLRRSSCGCRVALRTALRARGDPPRSPGRAGARR